MANWDKTEPRGTEGIKFGAMRLRDAKAALDQALKEEHHLIDDEGTLKAIHKMPYGSGIDGHEGRWRYNPSTTRIERYSSEAWGGVTPAPIPFDTRMIFCQASAPTGWTQVSEPDDALLRIIGTGNISDASGTWACSLAPSITTHNHGGTTGTTSITIMANYSTLAVASGTGRTGTSSVSNIPFNHAHTIAASGWHGHVVDTTSIYAWRPAYVNVLTAKKL